MDDAHGTAQLALDVEGTSARTTFIGSLAEQRKLGAYYTCPQAAMVMARWICSAETRTVLEPSFGSGVFIRAVRTAHGEGRGLRVFGAEISRLEVSHATAERLLSEEDIHVGDFLGMPVRPVDAVIGNPPYVRLRNLPERQERRALSIAGAAMGHEMESSGSLWMPFVLHAMSFLKNGGRMAVVLPYEFTYVRYALPLWRKLGRSFGELRVVRVHDRMFPDILQDVVILFASGYGDHTDVVTYETFSNTQALERVQPETSRVLSINSIVAGERSFVHALLPARLSAFLEERGSELTRPLGSLCTFNIGYVSGDKNFFNPPKQARLAFGLSADSLVPAITNGRQLKGMGIRTSNRDRALDDMLFLPKSTSKGHLKKSDSAYVNWGKANKVDQRYKCQVREPWYLVPGVKVPDVLLSVFADRPLMSLNDAGYVASNSLLCGYMKQGRSSDMVAAWYTSLTMLSCELEVHSLGGGVMILVPNEAGRINLPKVEKVSSVVLNGLDRRLRSDHVESAIAFGDEQLLKGRLKLSHDGLQAIQDGLDVLRRWRGPSDRGSEA